MVAEATKTNKLRDNSFFKQYLSGKVIDIGCAKDLVVKHAEPFDLTHGDAQYILDYRNGKSYDCVHSSHCLEHMVDVPAALAQWWQLVKPGGHLIIVVPDETLYEQGQWPSIYNDDHKASFRLRNTTATSNVSYCLEDLLVALPGAELQSIIQQDAGYDHVLKTLNFNPLGHKMYKWSCKPRNLIKKALGQLAWHYANKQFLSEDGLPIDQTLGKALAQIQAVVHKKI